MPGESLKRKSWLREEENIVSTARMDVALICIVDSHLYGCWLAKDDEPQKCCDCEKTICPEVKNSLTPTGICLSHQHQLNRKVEAEYGETQVAKKKAAE